LDAEFVKIHQARSLLIFLQIPCLHLGLRLLFSSDQSPMCVWLM
jgi:hypothetical protein